MHWEDQSARTPAHAWEPLQAANSPTKSATIWKTMALNASLKDLVYGIRAETGKCPLVPPQLGTCTLSNSKLLPFPVDSFL